MDGVIIINKSKGYTSHDIVNILRKETNIKKIGHTGTLDPNATGVLPVLIGKATKISKYLMEHDKIYIATIRLGQKTDTGDAEGRIILEKQPTKLDEKIIVQALEDFAGEQMQCPPMYSAVKIKGKKLYEYARNGEEISIKPRKIKIYDIKFLEYNNEKIKIIALTGKIGSGIDVIKSYLLRHKRVSPIIPAYAGSEELSSNEFLEKIVKGQIIEAYCNEENEIYGTDISQMLSTCLYVGIYTPNQIANMAECPNIELLPIEIDMNAEARFLHLLGYPHKEELTYKQLEEQEITNICKKFLKDNQYNNEDIENLWISLARH